MTLFMRTLWSPNRVSFTFFDLNLPLPALTFACAVRSQPSEHSPVAFSLSTCCRFLAVGETANGTLRANVATESLFSAAT